MRTLARVSISRKTNGAGEKRKGHGVNNEFNKAENAVLEGKRKTGRRWIMG